MRHAHTIAPLLALALAACTDDRGAPVVAEPAGLAASSVAGPTCPCWDAEALVGALPETDACVDQTAAEAPFLSVDLFDPSAATQTQAFTRYDGGSADAGSCRLAVVGTAGLVQEITAASGLPRADYEGCAALLVTRARATAAGC
jgi:hypothetical protein